MPSQGRVQELIAYAQQGKLIEAIEEFYAEDASVQENAGPARVGRAAMLEFERQMIATVAEVHEFKAVSFAVDGDIATINWVIDYTDTDGRHVHTDEVAWQTWHGDRIVHERFYYDTAARAA